MPLVQLTGPRNPAENPKAFVEAIRKRYANISTEDIQGMYTRAVMLAQPPVDSMSVVLFGRDILSDDVQSLPWWPYLSQRNKNAILAHPVATGVAVEGLAQAKQAMRMVGGRAGVSRESLVSLKGLENTYVWCKLTSWKQDVSPRDLDLILSQKDPKARKFVRSLRVIDDHGPYAYVRPYGEALVRERFPVRTGDDFNALVRDQTSTKQFHGFDAIKEQ